MSTRSRTGVDNVQIGDHGLGFDNSHSLDQADLLSGRTGRRNQPA